MIPLVIHTFAAFGLAFVVGFSRISLGFREWVAARSVWGIALLECPACVSYHFGWIAVAVGVAPDSFPRTIFGAITCGFFTCATSLLLAKLTVLDAHGS